MEVINSGEAWGSNTHAENTEASGLRLLIDWVTCSFYFAGEVAELLQVLGIDEMEFIREDRVRYEGYTCTHVSDSIQILENEDSGKFMLNFSGQGCRQFEEYSSLNWIYLFALIIDNFNAKFTRLDVAIDDFNKIYKVSTIRQATYKKLCVTRLRDWGNKQKGLIEYGNEFLTMDSFYLGDIKSRYMINFYDKLLERKAAGKEVLVESWTRTEIRFKAEYATLFANTLAHSNEDLGYNTMSFLNEKLAFLKPGGEYKNKSRAREDKENISRWWLKFLGNVGKLKISIKAPDATLEKSKDWFEHAVTPTLAMIYSNDPDNFEDFINKSIYVGSRKFKQKHLSILKNAEKNANPSKRN